jgi:hypothetical protein
MSGTSKVESFIKRAIAIHGDKYDYSKVEFTTISSKPKVVIICPTHGEFEQRYDSHLQGNGCKACAIIMRALQLSSNTPDFIKNSERVYGNIYDYSKSIYTGVDCGITIICPTHGEFKQTPTYHLLGRGCNKCRDADNRITKLSNFINRANIIHNHNYDYTLSEYNGWDVDIIISCHVHGVFNQSISNHLRGKGCPKCVGRGLSTIELIALFNNQHNNKYDYSLVNYVNCHTKITIICPKHGEFSQTPNNHKRGQGCPICKESKGEREIREFLINNNIKYIRQYRFNDCKYKRVLPFDFYLPELNKCIEYQGEQHYRAVDLFGGEAGFKNLQHRDKIKEKYCYLNNIPLLKIRFNDNIPLKLQDLKCGEITV